MLVGNLIPHSSIPFRGIYPQHYGFMSFEESHGDGNYSILMQIPLPAHM